MLKKLGSGTRSDQRYHGVQVTELGALIVMDIRVNC